MPRIKGDPAQFLTRAQRIEALIQAVGGPTEAARLSEKSRSTVDNWRKRGSAELDDLAELAQEAGISLDWVAFGGPDSGLDRSAQAPGIQGAAKVNAAPGADGVAISLETLAARLGIAPEHVRLVEIADGAMAPMLRRGALVLIDTRAGQALGDFVVVDGPRLVARRHYVMPSGQVQLTADADPNWRLSGPADTLPALFNILWYGQSV